MRTFSDVLAWDDKFSRKECEPSKYFQKAAEEGLVSTCLHQMELLLLASAHISPLRITTACFNQNGTNIVRVATSLQIIPPRNPLESILWGPGTSLWSIVCCHLLKCGNFFARYVHIFTHRWHWVKCLKSLKSASSILRRSWWTEAAFVVIHAIVNELFQSGLKRSSR